MGFLSRDQAKQYSPQDDDTLEKIARRETSASNPLTWKAIARFNWGTVDPDVIDEFMRDQLGCYQRGADKHFVFSADIDSESPLLIPQAFEKKGLRLNSVHTIRIKKLAEPPEQFQGCCKVSGPTFDFDKSFIRPDVVDDLEPLEEEFAKHPDAKIVIFGHTDKVGKKAYNKQLSERRAKSVHAFITNRADVWKQLSQDEKWGTREVQMVLEDLAENKPQPDWDPGPVDGIKGSRTDQAIREFQGDNGLGVDGIAGPNTWEVLAREYMAGKHDIEIEADRFMDPPADGHMGCGERNPMTRANDERGPDGREVDEADTEERCEENRRVTFFLFHEERLPRLPCQAGDIAPCSLRVTPKERLHNGNFSCSFYDSIAKRCPCEGGGGGGVPRRKLVKVAWKEGMDEIHPEYFPAKKEQKVPVTIQTRGVPDGTDGSAFEIELFGYREELKEGEDSRTPIRLPLTLLGIEAPADVKIKSDRLKSVKAGTRPALELRVPWTKVADLDGKDVYPVEMLTFKVQAKLKDGIPEEGRRSAELKRTIPVVIFANPDAVEKQERFWKSGEKIRDDAKGAKRLALLEAGRTPGKPSTFESGASRGVIPLKIPRTHMRGTSHAFYRGHGYLLTHDGKSPCQNCKFRDHWSQLSADDQKTYRANILQPTRWDGTKSKFVSMSWSALQKAVTDHDKIFIQFEMDESRGDANFTPTTTPGNLPWTTRLKSMFGALMSWDMDKLHEGLQFCMSKPSVALLRSAAATRLGGYSIPTDQNATNGPSFFSDGTATQGAPDIVGAAGPGQTVPKGTPIYINTIEAKCEQGEDVEGQRAGFIFWQSATGDTFAKKGGKPAMCFGHTGIAGWLLPDKVDSLDGEWPVPTDLMYASGCLTAATSELADSFLKKGTKVYIGNRIVAWGTWNRQMAEAFSKKVFTDKKTCEQAFNDLKGEYVGKLRCAMWKKTEGGTEYVDQ